MSQVRLGLVEGDSREVERVVRVLSMGGLNGRGEMAVLANCRGLRAGGVAVFVAAATC